MPRSRSQRLRMICDEHMSSVFVKSVGCAESGNAAAERRVCETEYELKLSLIHISEPTRPY